MANSNNFSYVTKFSNLLDKVVLQEITSFGLEADDARVQYDGGKTIKIASLQVGGLKDYSRVDGYKTSPIGLTWQEKQFNVDRGVRYVVDAMDLNETAFIPTTALLLGEHARTKIAPELDSFRYSQIAKKTHALGNKNYIANEKLTAETVFDKIFAAIYSRADLGYNLTDIEVYLPWTIYTLLLQSEKIMKRVDPGQGYADLKYQIKTIDGVRFIPVSSDRMKTGYTINAGTDSYTDDGGYTALSAALGINYLIIPKGSVIAKVKHKVDKIIQPSENQTHDAYFVLSRLYHDIFFMDNQAKGLFASFDAALPATASTAFGTVPLN